MMQQIMMHPIDFFRDLQHPERVRWMDGLLLLFLAYIVRMASLLLIGYHFESREPYEISYLHEFIWLFIPLLTWCVSNWSVSTILDGEGKFKEILVGTCYCLVPYIIFSIPLSLITNIIALNESFLYVSTANLIYIWVGWLILCKMKILHDFELGKLIWITFITILGVLIIWFIGILLFGLMSQFINFFFDILKELRFRM